MSLYTQVSNIRVASPQSVTYRVPVKKQDPVIPKPKPDAYIPPVENGLAPVLSTIDTKQPVVFLGIDDGAYKKPEVVTLLRQYHIKATLFLADAFIASDPKFFTQIDNAVIEDHTLSHDLNMAKKPLAYQQQEICSMADKEKQYYGRRPILFRPPGGAYSRATLQAAANCGMRAVVNWIAKANGGSMQYQIGNKLRPGDIVLMHFRPEFKQDLEAFVAAETAAGLHTELLEDWIK
jgi:peptidoglycan/xylan/chitin deacetylase (PgdA/CDA1 family)